MDVSTKACVACNVAKPVVEFHKNRNKPDGLTVICKPCACARAARWASNNPDRHKANCEAYYTQNRDRMLVVFKNYRAENYEALAESGRLWRVKNPERKAAADRAWQIKHPDRVREFKVACEQKRRCAPGEGFTASDIRDIIKSQKFKCAICRVSIRKKRHMDHIKPLSKGGHNVRKNMQALCRTCNLRKSGKDPLTHMQSLGFLL